MRLVALVQATAGECEHRVSGIEGAVMDTPDTTAPGFTGWQRLPGQSWHAVATGDTYDAALRATLAVRFPGSNRRDIVVVRGDADPNKKRVCLTRPNSL